MVDFVVSYVSFFDNELHSEIVYNKSSWVDALRTSFNGRFSYLVDNQSYELTLELCKAMAFDTDQMINVIEI